ncbi:MAG: DUF4435 domain-containing protein [Bacteroidales bacterium]|nr:DUF4435 domain-containing protein [Bacteroidales bacterium]
MLKSLKDTVCEPSGTQSAIRQALKSPAGMRIAWVVVEAEEDVAVYEKFMQRNSTVVKTSADSSGRKGYANVEIIVQAIREEEPRAHIMGIRDADYSRYKEEFLVPVNIFLTDRRDLEMMLLEANSVKQVLQDWIPSYDKVLSKCAPVCRHFGYLRIYNDVADLSVKFHDYLRPSKYWDFRQQAMAIGWKRDSIAKFVALSDGGCTTPDVTSFIATHKLEEEELYDVCRGHDMLKLLSLTLVDVQTYSVGAIMAKMTAAYSLEDFKATKLYASIQAWQAAEGVVALAA